MNNRIDNIKEVIEKIKEDPTNIRYLEKKYIDLYEEIYKYYNDELKKDI